MDTKTIYGFPYFPGVVSGSLLLGGGLPRPDRILVITQKEITTARDGWGGIVVIEAAPFSHAMIRILGLGVPTLIVSGADAESLEENMQVRLDADTGKLVLGADAVVVLNRPSREVSAPQPGQSIRTLDGTAVSLRASVRSAAAAQLALRNGAESIGLIRSEFLMPDDGRPPDVKYCFSVFQEIAEAAHGLPLTLRLIDLAGDKRPDWLEGVEALNTPLGMQGARLFACEQVESVFHAQLEAIDRLSDRFDFRLLIPYLVRREELAHWIHEIRSRMQNHVPIAAMVETPAGAMDLSNWFDMVDFAAVGCNDLMQCLFAADRDLPELRHYLDPYAPVLYRLLASVAQSTRAGLQRIQLCGVLSQLPGVLPLLLGLGFRAFSVEPRLIPRLAQRVRQTSVAEAAQLVKQVCAAKETQEVLMLLGMEEMRISSLPW